MDKSSDDIDMGDGRPSTSHNIMDITTFHPHTLKMEFTSPTESGRGMEGDWNVITEGIRESLASGERERIIPSQESEMRTNQA